MTLYLTTAARNQLADAAGPALAALTLTRLQVGSGSGPGGAADGGRTALRAPRDAAAVAELDAPDGTLAVAAETTGTADYDVTEAGLFGRVGAGAELLVAYWSNSGAVLAGVANGGTLELAATLGIQDVTGPAVALSQDVPGPPGLPGDCAQTEAGLAACEADLATRTTGLAACEADLATRTTGLAACEAARNTALADAMAAREALAGDHLVTAAGVTTFIWPWPAATRARVTCVGGGGGGGGGSARVGSSLGAGGGDGDDGEQTQASLPSAGTITAAGGRRGLRGRLRTGDPANDPAIGNGGNGGAASPNHNRNEDGQGGTAGAAVAGTWAGLAVGSEITISVGSGGPGGSSTAAGVGSPGSPGFVRISPQE